MFNPSPLVLQSLLDTKEIFKGEWRLNFSKSGKVEIWLYWKEWNGMGSELEMELVFRGEPYDAFTYLCRRINME